MKQFSIKCYFITHIEILTIEMSPPSDQYSNKNRTNNLAIYFPFREDGAWVRDQYPDQFQPASEISLQLKNLISYLMLQAYMIHSSIFAAKSN